MHSVLGQLPPREVAALEHPEHARSHNDGNEPPRPRGVRVLLRREVLRVDVRQMVHKEDGEDTLRERLPGMPFHLYAKTKRFDMNMEL